ncbi:phosphohexomutase domain-containing protein [Flocculibacter collagenilyticus]|uniref:phosphomannomutase CpsG n=1 Tax=Flocculibacter collagenilyticus TaxID=2744479 RepID=UPI002D800A14|nr:phosphomannomutase CpsG [Flocculibacter collagenilyticus]
MEITCFKAYDIRGQLGEQLNEQIAYRIGRAFGDYMQPKQVVLGGDMRATSEALKTALAEGLMDAGVNVIDLGMTGTEEVYFATFFLGVDGGIEVTASHNPIDYNGMKLVKKGSQPISGDSGLFAIQAIAEQGEFKQVDERGTYVKKTVLDEYISHLLNYIDVTQLKPMKIVVNAGNGAAGHVIDKIEQQFQQQQVPVEFIKVHHDPDPTFPNGIPNPLLPENRACTQQAVIKHNADLGLAWDGDFDRCFMFDENGRFIEGYYIVGLLAEAFLQKNPGEKIIHDPRLTWNTVDIVATAGGEAVQSKTGHAFIKERMRKENAVYGGEMSAHHYFRDFAYCDSGMIPWLLVAELICLKSTPLSELLNQRMAAFPSPGEINRSVKDADSVIKAVLDKYESDALAIDYTDGISLDMGQWRFNLRKSNTEPLIRLNLETQNDAELMQVKVKEVLAIADAASA